MSCVGTFPFHARCTTRSIAFYPICPSEYYLARSTNHEALVVILCVLLSSHVYLLYCVCIAVFTLDAGLLARSQYSEGPATGHPDTGFCWYLCVCKKMLRWFPKIPSCYYMLLM